MANWYDYIESVGDVWIAWLLSVVFVAVISWRAVARLRCDWLKALLVEERGAAYALPYALQFPVFVFIVCMIIQSTMILMVKMGSVYAAYAAARAAIVWHSAEPNPGHGLAEEKADMAARFAMTPFASSYQFHRDQLYPDFNELDYFEMGQQYFESYMHLARENNNRASGDKTNRFIRDPNDSYTKPGILNKYYFASLATKTTVNPTTDAWNRDLTATVVYQMPMHIPGVGKLFRTKSESGVHVREIITSATLPSETPKDCPNGKRNHPIGIPYKSEK